ncbi:hypothetical protein N0V86_009175 [Didymella sp. IMI 355093]|nr:hypothetical protein N0V86_009175 [Didymella sp. IMI 355093]
MLAFIYMAYQMVALLYETVPTFEDTWIECLGDLGRYRMAIEDEDIRDRETWASVARSWYSKAADKNPSVYYYGRSLNSVEPFPSARESVMTLFRPPIEREVSNGSPPLPVDSSFIEAHAHAFVRGSADRFEASCQNYLSQLDNHIGRVTAKWKEQGVYTAVTNVSGWFDYGVNLNPLRQLFRLRNEMRKDPDYVVQALDPGVPLEKQDPQKPRFTEQALLPKLKAYETDLTFCRTAKLTCDSFALVLRRIGDKNVLPHVHIMLSFFCTFAAVDVISHFIDRAPWADVAGFLNTLIKTESQQHQGSDVYQSLKKPVFAADGEEETQDELPLPEDYLIRGLIWVEEYLPANWFRKEYDEEERLGYQLSSHLHSVTTTAKDLTKRLKRIPFADLSKTFQDAVQITRELGQRYLWIDSLCIIQDDRSDWAKEAALMAEVYGNSLCTLAALSSRDGTEGCNRTADIQRSTRNTFIDLNWNRNAYPFIRIFEKEPRNWDDEYDGGLDGNGCLESPLRHRAWVLQEKELSRRSIHFGKNQLLWECRETKATAQLPWEQWKREEDLIYKKEWYELVEDYTLRSITAATDKLPALSGLAKRHQEGNSQYMAGIWSSQFPGALLWQTKDLLAIQTSRASKDDTYIAPSWSWASIQGRISYDSQRLLLPVETYARDNPSRKWNRTFRNIRLERAVTVPSVTKNPYGAIEAAFLTLSGAHIINVDLPPHSRGSRQLSEPLEVCGKQIGLFYRDTADALAGAKYAFFLALQDEPYTPLNRNDFQTRQAGRMIDLVMGIMLIKNSHHTDTYKRAGLIRWVDAELLVRSKAQTIKLV